MVVEGMFGVLNMFPVESNVPPEDRLNQFMVSLLPGVAESVSNPAPQLESPIVEGALGSVFIIAVTGTLIAETHDVVKSLTSA